MDKLAADRAGRRTRRPRLLATPAVVSAVVDTGDLIEPLQLCRPPQTTVEVAEGVGDPKAQTIDLNDCPRTTRTKSSTHSADHLGVLANLAQGQRCLRHQRADTNGMMRPLRRNASRTLAK